MVGLPRITTILPVSSDTIKLKPGLSGYICVRNGNRLDYCWKEAVLSLVLICDEVVVCDSDSDDGTLQDIEDLMLDEPKVRLVQWPYPNPPPFGDRDWTNRWYNWTREQLGFDMQINFDADEILDPCSFPEIREAVAKRDAKMARYIHFNHRSNMVSQWGDGRKPLLAPTEMYMHTHGPGPEGLAHIRDVATDGTNIVLYHYSTLRRPDCYAAKMKVVIPALEGWIPTFEHLDPLPHEVPNFFGKHPDVIVPWLKERGHAV